MAVQRKSRNTSKNRNTSSSKAPRGKTKQVAKARSKSSAKATTPSSSKKASKTTMSSTSLYSKRLAELRKLMKQHGLDYYVVPSGDEHLNEYLPDENKRREYISGFTGSAGDALIGLKEAWVFADSRYYEQVDAEVDGKLFNRVKLGETGVLSCLQTLEQQSQKSKTPITIGYDAFTVTLAWENALENLVKKASKGIKKNQTKLKVVDTNLVDGVWLKDPNSKYPSPVNKPVIHLPEKYTGQSSKNKLKALRDKMKALNASVLPITKLDQICWLLNLRGSDIPYNPVFMAYAIVSMKDVALFCDKFPTETVEQILKNNAQNASKNDKKMAKNSKKTAKNGQKSAKNDPFFGLNLKILPYSHYKKELARHAKSTQSNSAVLIDPSHTTAGSHRIVIRAKGKVKQVKTPIEMMKALKNPTEVKWIKAAHIKSSKAKSLALWWMYQQLKYGQRVSELSFANELERRYASERGYMGLSFNTISGAGANSSIVHYGTPSPRKALTKGELFLVDSGVHYVGGTTDCTRTMIIGKPSLEQKQQYTAVLKAHIACANQKFPSGTDGVALDAITRSALWQQGLDFGHGTGHGVGAFLNVHEGPNGIHKRAVTPFEVGMVTSIEPGYYAPGKGGIRLENLYVVREASASGSKKASKDAQKWLVFESLTYIPFDKKLILLNQLTDVERRWLEKYHYACVQKIGKYLSRAERQWLQKYCKL